MPAKVPPWGVASRARRAPARNRAPYICNPYIILLTLALTHLLTLLLIAVFTEMGIGPSLVERKQT